MSNIRYEVIDQPLSNNNAYKKTVPHMDPYMQAQERANNYDYCMEITNFIEKKVHCLKRGLKPRIAIICGSGLGFLADELTESEYLEYKNIPGFPVGNVQGHKGRLVFGYLCGEFVVCMQGRVHPYEGRTLAECALPIRISKLLGARILLMTSAVGGINGGVQRGDLMAVYDQIFVPGMALRSPLVGPNEDRFGPRFPSATDLYSRKLRAIAREVAREEKITLREGVYACVGGPQYETPAEVRWLKNAGADVVGMSVAHETIVARHCGMQVLSISLITNICETNSDAPMQKDLHGEVLEASEKGAEKTSRLIKGIVTILSQDPTLIDNNIYVKPVNGLEPTVIERSNSSEATTQTAPIVNGH